jgi:hypothetical protein
MRREPDALRSNRSANCFEALLHKLTDAQGFHFFGGVYSLTSVMVTQYAVKPFRTATRIWNSES